jgi:hypothetical protein
MTDEKKEALAALQKAATFAPAPGVLFAAPWCTTTSGDNPALKWLQRALAAGLPVNVINSTPDLDHLHSNPAFRLYYAALRCERGLR